MKTLSLTSDDRRVLRAVFDAVSAGGKGADVMQLAKNLRVIDALKLDEVALQPAKDEPIDTASEYKLEDADWEVLLKLFRSKNDWSTRVDVTRRVVAVWEKLGTPTS